MIYVCSPYSAPTPNERHDRYLEVVQYMVKTLQSEPHVVRYSPIMLWHYPAVIHQLGTANADFAQHNEWMISRADKLEVLCLGGWEESKGIAEELEWAEQHHIGVFLITP